MRERRRAKTQADPTLTKQATHASPPDRFDLSLFKLKTSAAHA
ncbi:peptidase C45 [Burkholderia thailandensis]|nr:peptidase C45 [Burkholderia thailandensis]AVR29248.1 peptidase C45 [Burkholderia thailandensis]AWY62634.1 peptidase C45 [Burkholderia thailandensis]AWY66161.1 peptidase C45 [Burkholderia thailandensis]MDD1484112.1 peptidase C45 [Burkholderia thailandensis]